MNEWYVGFHKRGDIIKVLEDKLNRVRSLSI